MYKKTLQFLSGIMLVSCFSVGNAWAQAVSGSISGYVTDPSGAAVPGASIVITNAKTGVATNALTDSVGLYNVTNLPPGEYSLAVEARGFKRFLQEKITLVVYFTVRYDAKLEVGALTQEVTVTAAPPLLKAEKVDVSRTVDERAVQDLPTLGRNLTLLYTLMPGVIQNTFSMAPGENPSEFNSVHVNGSFIGSSTYMIDGNMDINLAGESHWQVIVPNQESVQEMKVTTSNYDPEFGATAGMVVQYVTKSGTNDLHGSAYWFNRNKATFAANPFTEKVPGTGKNGRGFGPAPFNYNQGGFSLGGPIKKNRMFLFGDYDLVRQVLGNTLTVTVPNDAFRSGDFSALAATNPIFDPLTGNPDGTGRTQFFATSNPADATYNPACTSPTPCMNIIPVSRISPVATNLLGLLPSPNISQGYDLNFNKAIVSSKSRDQFDVRYDWNISDKDKFFVRYTYFGAFFDNPGVFGKVASGPAVIGGSPIIAYYRDQSTALNYTHTFGPSLLAEVRLGWLRHRLDERPGDAGLRTNDQVGIPNINTGDIATQGLAGMNVSGPVGMWMMGIGSGYGLPWLERDQFGQVISNWTKMKGSHQIRWGTDITRVLHDERVPQNYSSRGDFDFGQSATASADSLGSGLGTATFLLGLPTYFRRSNLTSYPGDRQTRWAFYGQDVWKVTRKLTVNYGLRWDYFQPWTPRRTGELVNFDFDHGYKVLGGLGDVSRSANVKGDKNDFSPRVGFAYKLLESTVIRAGFGRSYYSGNYGGSQTELLEQYPLAGNQNVIPTSFYGVIFPLDQGPPAPPPPEFPQSGHLPVPPGDSVQAVDYNFKTESVDSWNFTVEHQLARDFKVSVGYVGNTSHQYDQQNVNSAPPGPGDLLSRRPLYQKFGIDGPVSPLTNSLRANYNSLQIVVEKRFSNGYMVNSSYAWAKALDRMSGGFEAGGQSSNPYDRNGSYGVSGYNRASVWTLSHVWQLPYGKGLPYGSNATGIKKALLAGWQFNGVTTVESGLAFSPYLNDGSTLNADFGQRPDRLPGVSLVPAGGQTPDNWYNVAAFAPPSACCRWGDAGKGILRGPALIAADWSFFKQFSFTSPLNRENTTLEFRWENFNFFNNTNLDIPNPAVDSSLAGKITGLAGSGPGGVTMRRMQFGLRLGW